MTPSLGARLLRHVMLPLALTWALGTLIAVGVGNKFAEQAFDTALLDDAHAVGANVRLSAAGLLDLGLSDDALEAVLFDRSETMYFAVLRHDGSLLAGREGLRAATAPTGNAAHAFSNIRIAGDPMRAVRLVSRTAPGYSVVIAQTTSNRTELLTRLIVYSIAPQLVLLALLGWGLRRTLRRDLAPLETLQRTLAERDASDLTPVTPALQRDPGSREVEQLGIAIDALLDRVGDGVRAQREFAGNVAHELRTPLAGIRALAEYGLARRDDPALLREQLGAIVQAQGRASRLVDQLLALALADEARASLSLEPVDLATLAREVVLRCMPRADQAGVDLGAQGLDDGAPAEVRTNPALVEAMLTNLLDNALRYGRAAGRAPVITVELARGPNEWRLAVIDNGPGLKPDERRSLLQRWSQGAHGARLGEGAGLGLAIVARYADLLGARFELNDGPNGEGVCALIVFTPSA